MFHPDYFSDRELSNEIIDQSVQLDVLLHTIIEPSEQNEHRLFDVEKRMLELHPSEIWNIYVDGNKELQVEKDFKQFMIAVKEHTGFDKEDMTVGDFYTLLEYLRDKNKTDGRKSGDIQVQ